MQNFYLMTNLILNTLTTNQNAAFRSHDNNTENSSKKAVAMLLKSESLHPNLNHLDTLYIHKIAIYMTLTTWYRRCHGIRIFKY